MEIDEPPEAIFCMLLHFSALEADALLQLTIIYYKSKYLFH